MRFSLLITFVIIGHISWADETDTLNFDSLRNIEYHLEGLSYNIINGEDQSTRITSCFYFVQTLKKALQIPNSFNYPFSNLKTVSILKPDDERFRIFTWNLLLDSGRYMYFGAIQMNRSDKLELFGLYDSSKFNRNSEYESFDNRHWVGALYYQIHEYKYKGKKHYLLFGWDGEDEFINKKVIDVLWFDENNNPKFGAPVFDYDGVILNRVVFKFSEKTAMLLRYESKGDIIVFAHLVPVNPMFKGKYEHYVPDGTYDYFKFQKGFWVKQDGLFSKKKDYKKVRQPE